MSAPTKMRYRLVTRCIVCRLIQYRSSSGLCVRCGAAVNLAMSHIGTSESRNESELSISRRIGIALKQLRIEHRLSQSQLATKMRTGRPQVTRLENGVCNPSLRTIERAALALGIDIAEVFLRLPLCTRDPATIREYTRTQRLEGQRLDQMNLWR